MRSVLESLAVESPLTTPGLLSLMRSQDLCARAVT